MDTDPITRSKGNSGAILESGDVDLSPVTQCLTDRFSVSNADGPNPPTICGTNTGEHSKEIFC